MYQQTLLFLVFLTIIFGLWLIFDDAQQDRFDKLQMLIFESNSRDKSPSVEESNDKVAISRVFMDWYKRQAKERGDYVNKTVSKDLYNILAPEAFCPRIRIGRIFDGGKWMCDPVNIPEGCVIFSLGIAGMPSFDEAVQKYTDFKCKIFGYDKDPRKISLKAFQTIRGFSRAITLSDKTDRMKNTSTIEDLMTLENVTKIEILKIDIEGAEYKVMVPFLKKNTVCQILIEIHNTNHDKTKAMIRDIARFDYLLFNFEVNPYAVFQATEFSFIHKSCLERYSAIELARYLN